MRKLFLLLPAVVTLSACDRSPTAPTQLRPQNASRALVINRRFDVATTALSDCGRENVTVTGTFHRVLTITSNQAGGFHVNDHADFTGLQGTGVISGANYVSRQISVVNFNIPGPTIGLEVTQLLTFTLIGQGTVQDEVVTALVHYTINANGELTTFVDNFRIKCS